MILIAPLAVLTSPFIIVCNVIKRRRLGLIVLAVDGEFAPVVELMELLRTSPVDERPWRYLLVLSKYKHQALDALYSEALHCRIIRSGKLSHIAQQVLLLQPDWIVSITELRGSRTFVLPERALEVSSHLANLRKTSLESIGLGNQKYVAMAVFSLKYDEERDCRELAKVKILESNGSELVSGIDYLRDLGIGVVLLGSEDTNNSRIPRDLARLSALGPLGGAHEVALASGCEYFWNDFDVGAWWLGLPFKRPILTTNKPRIRLKTKLDGYEHLVVPVRYQHRDGTDIGFRELLSMKSAPFKAASRGEILMIRNSPDEIVEAHREMVSRISGQWSDDSHQQFLREKCQRIFLDFPDTNPMNISAYFLAKHSHLLEYS